MSSIDLNSPPPGHKFNISVERDETDGERKVRLFKDVALFIVAISFVVLIVFYCFQTLIDINTSPDAKRWAQSVLSAAAGGILGYLIKK